MSCARRSLPASSRQAKSPAQAVAIDPAGAPSRIIFLHCQLSVKKSVGEERVSSPPSLGWHSEPQSQTRHKAPGPFLMSCILMGSSIPQQHTAPLQTMVGGKQIHKVTCLKRMSCFLRPGLFMLYLEGTTKMLIYCTLDNYTRKQHLTGLGLLWRCVLGHMKQQQKDHRP